MSAPFIELADVTKTWPRGGARALDGLSLAIPEGEVFGLIGPNGAGKSTLLSVLLGLTRKDSGRARVGGCDLDTQQPEIRAQCALAPQDFGFYPTLTVAENLSFYAAAGGLSGAARRARVASAMAQTQLETHAGKRAQALSGGLKRRLNLALALLHEPRALFLDEPTAGVDPQSRAFILDVVRALCDRGTTVVYTTHYMDEVQQVCSRVAILDHGRVLAQGPLGQLLASDRALHVTLSAPATEALLGELERAFPRASLEGAQLSLPTEDPLGTAGALAPLLARHGLHALSLRHRDGDLESLFLRLTRRRLRD